MAAQALVLCRDPEVLSTFGTLLSELHMGYEVCLGDTGATHKLQDGHFSLIIIECARDFGGNIFKLLRARPSNQDSVAVGIVSDDVAAREAFANGATFVLHKPVPVEDAKRVLRITTGMVTRMVRRFLRCTVEQLTHISLSGVADAPFVLDLSEGGTRIQALEILERGTVVHFEFTLPATGRVIAGDARVAWSDASGRAGLEFMKLSDVDRGCLKDWVRGRHQANESGTRAAGRTFLFLRHWRLFARGFDTAVVLLTSVAFLLACLQLPGAAARHAVALGMVITALTLAAYVWLFSWLRVTFPGTRVAERLLTSPHPRVWSKRPHEIPGSE